MAEQIYCGCTWICPENIDVKAGPHIYISAKATVDDAQTEIMLERPLNQVEVVKYHGALSRLRFCHQYSVGGPTHGEATAVFTKTMAGSWFVRFRPPRTAI